MKYTESVTIDLPRSRVVELFDDPENLPRWQPELIELEPIEGIPGQEGSKLRLVSRQGRREIEMIQTVRRRNLPQEFSEVFETANVWNQVDSRFIELGDRQTRWELDSQFRCQGLLRLMTWVAPGVFRRQTRKTLQQFKRFAESSSQT